MNPERFHQIERIFFQALEVAPHLRPQFLDTACAADPALRREVELLLASDDGAKTHIGGVIQHAAATLDSPQQNQRIGPYLLVREIGRGGMGVVFQAIRNDGEYIQAVAIKLIRQGLDSDQITRRFRAERQILATLQHPNIANLLDGGTTSDGRPYLVMEYIEGKPLLDYAQGLSPEAKIQLFLDVCAAVEHAHARGVIHRDIKPGNILVTSAGIPKLLDFGVAKLLNPEFIPGGEPLTRTGVRIMTPSYASPEQVRGEPVTIASDIYSLGAVFFELLSSQRLSRGDMPLDGLPREIVRKATSELPANRYPSVAALAADLRRALQPEPATPRRRFLFVALLILTLTAGALLSRSFRRAPNDTRDPQVRAMTIRALDLIRQDPSVRETAAGIPPNFTQALQLLQQAVARDPQYAAAWNGLAYVYDFIANMEPKRQDHWTAKAKAAARTAITHDPDQADSHALLGSIAFFRDWDLAAAERSYKRAIDLNTGNSYAIQEYADLLRLTGRVEQAITEVERAISLTPGEPRLRVQRGLFYYDAGRLDDCLEEASRALHERPNDREGLWLRGLCLQRNGQFDEAERSFLQVLAHSPADGRALPALGNLYGEIGKRNQAEQVLAQLEALRQKGKKVQYGMALVYAGLGDIAPALYWLEQAYALRDLSTLYMKVDYRFRPLNAEPAFHDLLRKTRLIR